MSVRPVAFNTYKDNFLDKRVSPFVIVVVGFAVFCWTFVVCFLFTVGFLCTLFSNAKHLALFRLLLLHVYCLFCNEL